MTQSWPSTQTPPSRCRGSKGPGRAGEGRPCEAGGTGLAALGPGHSHPRLATLGPAESHLRRSRRRGSTRASATRDGGGHNTSGSAPADDVAPRLAPSAHGILGAPGCPSRPSQRTFPGRLLASCELLCLHLLVAGRSKDCTKSTWRPAGVVAVACDPALWEAEAGGSSELRSSRPARET